MRLAIYARVSSEEQALHGLSIEAQLEALEAWAGEHHAQVINQYIDAGISARKKAYHRPALQRLLKDVSEGKIDLIIFTKLDRWFRNISEYYKVQEVLEKHHVNWRTIHEDYDTSTASGRLKINIMLSVAQDEADRTSERIKAVFESKSKRNEVVSGKVPLGYKIESKHLVVDETTAPIAKDIFQEYVKIKSLRALRKYVMDKYGMVYTQSGLRLFLQNTRYIGQAHGNHDFCEPIIDLKTFNIVQQIIATRAERTNFDKTDHVYLFTGIIYCAECGNRLAAHTVRQKYIYYRCTKYEKLNLCTHKKRTSELILEDWLLQNVIMQLEKYNTELANAAKNRPQIDESKIKRKLARLKELFLNDLIERDEYEQDYMALKSALIEAQEQNVPQPQPIDINAMRNVLEVYSRLPRIAKKEFWTRAIKKIIITNNDEFSIIPNTPY